MVIRHRIQGEGEHKVFLLHTWPMGSISYASMLQYLDHKKFSYIALDFRGYGTASQEPAEYSIKQCAQDVIDIADWCGLDKFSLVGNSMGGQIAQSIAASVPDRVRGAVLFNPVPASGAPMEGDALQIALEADRKPDNRGILMSYLTGDRLSDAWTRTMVQRSVDTATPEAIAGYFKAFSSTDLSEEVNGCPVPVKILLGEHDPSFTPEIMRETVMKWFPNSSLETIANAGHFAPLEVPCYSAQLVEQFLASLTS